MSDFVARLAARAVGEVSAARPRIRARFETPVEGAFDANPWEDTPTPVAAPDPDVPAVADQRVHRDVAAPGSGGAEREPGAPAAFVARAGVAPRATPLERREAAPSPPRTDTAEPVESITLAARVMADARAPASGFTTSSPGAKPVPSPVVPGAPRVQRIEPHAQPAETPTVHIHIGRLDVRANLEPPVSAVAVEPPSAATTGDARLSLSDYLRGKRPVR